MTMFFDEEDDGGERSTPALDQMYYPTIFPEPITVQNTLTTHECGPGVQDTDGKDGNGWDDKI